MLEPLIITLMGFEPISTLTGGLGLLTFRLLLLGDDRELLKLGSFFRLPKKTNLEEKCVKNLNGERHASGQVVKNQYTASG